MRIAAAVSIVVWAPHVVRTCGDDSLPVSQLACVDRNDEPKSWLERRRFVWPSLFWRNLGSWLFQDRAYSVSNRNPSGSSGNFVVRAGSNGIVELHVYRGDETCSEKIASYELLTQLDLELGEKVQHVNDYAYSPVLAAETQSTINIQDDVSSQDMEENISLHHGWWQWWIPWKTLRDKSAKHNSFKYKMNDKAFAGGSHGEIWRGRRKCLKEPSNRGVVPCSEVPLIFKRLKVEHGFRTLEAGLREVHFGNVLDQFPHEHRDLFTRYIDHFFGNDGELWIVFEDSGLSLRSLLYTAVDAGGFIVFQQSYLWTLIRMSLYSTQGENRCNSNVDDHSVATFQGTQIDNSRKIEDSTWKQLMKKFLRQILEGIKVLHDNGIVHRDIKPSNIMCKSNVDLQNIQLLLLVEPHINCVLGDFSSAYDDESSKTYYTGGPSRLEHTNEYAPPEAIFGFAYNDTSVGIAPSFDLWSVGILVLEVLLGTPNVFSVDQRTRMVLSSKMRKKGASDEDIERAMYLAALTQFCIYNPLESSQREWPLRDGDPLHQSAMTKQTCTLIDFHRALRARDPLGWGFESSDSLLHLIWQLLSWDPKDRITVSDALKHPYFTETDAGKTYDPTPGDHNAVESQMLDPRMDFNVSDSVSMFRCPKCGRSFTDWKSCHMHANSRNHSKFCFYDRSTLPTCLNSHALLPAHSFSGYCDIQGRRRTIEDFHSIHLLPFQQFYGIFDGHLGNFASKYAASILYDELYFRLTNISADMCVDDWKRQVESFAIESFAAVHDKFLATITRVPRGFMDQSGTTATTLLVTNRFFVIMSLGDSRAVMSTRKLSDSGMLELKSIQLTKDHVAADKEERKLVESRGGQIVRKNGLDRVMGSLVVTRSIGDASLAPFLSRVPQVISMTREEVYASCGYVTQNDSNLCFFILASDGLWDTVSNDEAVDMVALVVEESMSKNNSSSWQETAALQQAAEALTHEAFIRGSTDNIGVCVVAIT